MILDTKKLNKNIPIPLYYQLKELLLEDIKINKYSPGDPIPTEFELSEHFKISRPTVRQAINELVNEGYLYRVKGKGTFIARPKIFQQFAQIIDNYNDEMIKKGLIPMTKVLELRVANAPESVIAKLGIHGDSKVISLKRLRYANNEPVVIVRTFVPYDLCPELLDIDLEKESLYKSLESRTGLAVKKVKRTFEARSANELDAKLLDIEKGDPIHYFETVAWLEDGRPVEYSISKYRGDRNKFTVEIERK